MLIDRFGIHIGFLYIRFYALIIMTGAVIAAVMSARRARKYGQDPERVWDILTWVLIAGIIGARLWHIFTPPPSNIAQGLTTAFYLTHPFDALAIWKGGLGIPGAVAGGALALYAYTRKHKLSFLTWADIAAPGLLVAQAVGRWGNFVNEEIYGAPTNLPWAIFIDPPYRLPEFADKAYYHPLFLYESIWNIGMALLLIWLGDRYRDRLKPGDVFLGYLVAYPLGRFMLDFLRLDASQLGGINANQTLMAVVGILAIVALFLRHRPGSASNQHDSEPA